MRDVGSPRREWVWYSWVEDGARGRRERAGMELVGRGNDTPSWPELPFLDGQRNAQAASPLPSDTYMIQHDSLHPHCPPSAVSRQGHGHRTPTPTPTPTSTPQRASGLSLPGPRILAWPYINSQHEEAGVHGGARRAQLNRLGTVPCISTLLMYANLSAAPPRC
jgi:hypothetical protein